jgi:hypothetical protein
VRCGVGNVFSAGMKHCVQINANPKSHVSGVRCQVHRTVEGTYLKILNALSPQSLVPRLRCYGADFRPLLRVDEDNRVGGEG